MTASLDVGEGDGHREDGDEAGLLPVGQVVAGLVTERWHHHDHVDFDMEKKLVGVFNKPGVAGAVLHTPP